MIKSKVKVYKGIKLAVEYHVGNVIIMVANVVDRSWTPLYAPSPTFSLFSFSYLQRCNYVTYSRSRHNWNDTGSRTGLPLEPNWFAFRAGLVCELGSSFFDDASSFFFVIFSYK